MFATPNLNGVSTTSDAAVTVLPARSSPGFQEHLTVVNESGIKAYISLDNGASWFVMPADSGPTSRTFMSCNNTLSYGVLAKRFPGGTNVTGLYAYAF